MVSYENLFIGHVLPLAKFRRTGPGEYQPIAAVGTGFTFGEGTFVTCWHCVSQGLDADEVYGAAVRSEGTDSQRYDRVHELTNLQRDAQGHDLALARIGYTVDPVLTLANDPAAWGEDVVACGYPVPVNTRGPETREPRIEVNASLLRGYVTRLRMDDRPGWEPVRAYELDMPAPGGVSGSPLCRADPFEIVGVVYREHDIILTDPDTKESRTVATFSYAHHLSTLRDARGLATDDRPLHEYLVRDRDNR